MKLWTAAMAIVGKDLRVYCRDRTGLLLGLLLPIALVTVFGMVMKFAFGGEGGMPKVSLWVVDDDHSPASQRFVQALRDVGMLAVSPKPDDAPISATKARQKVLDGEEHHVLIVEPGYGKALEAGEEPPLRLVQDPGRAMESKLVGIGLMQATMAAANGTSMPWLLGSVMRRQGMSDAGVQRVRAAMETVQAIIARFVVGNEPDLRRLDAPKPLGQKAVFDMASMFEDMVPVQREDVSPPDRPKMLGYQLAQSVCGMTVMMLMFGLMACSSTLLTERDRGTLRRLLVSPAPRHALLLGKFVFCMLVGLLQLAVMFTYGEVLFSVGTFRDPITLIVLAVTWSAAATSFGMLIAVWARTTKQAEGLSTMLILVMAALGGCWFPIQVADLPTWAEVVTHATLTHWAMSAFQNMFWNQKSILDPVMLRAVAVLWGFVVVAAIASTQLWRRRFVAG